MERKKEITRPQRLVSACVGAFLTSLSVTPFDVVKTRMQALAHQTRGVKGLCTICDLGPYKIFTGLNDGELWCYKCKNYTKTVEPVRANTLSMFLQILRYEGGWRLWRGLSPTLAMSVPSTVLYFNIYDELSALLKDHKTCPNSMVPMISGIVSRSFAASVVSPIELVRTRAMAREDAGNVIVRVSRDLYRETRTSGIQALYRGLAPTLYRDVPFSGVYWTMYEYLKVRLPEYFKLNEENAFAVSFTSGALSGMTASLVTHPMDVVKTRHQIDRIKGSTYDGSNSFSSISQLIRSEGISSLYVGSFARVAKVAPACAIMISSYEVLKRFFEGSDI